MSQVAQRAFRRNSSSGKARTGLAAEHVSTVWQDAHRVSGKTRMRIIDEVQRVPELLLGIKAVVDVNPEPGQFLLTGSARVLGMRGVADSLPGRSETIELWPLSQDEIDGVPGNFVLAWRGVPGRLSSRGPCRVSRGCLVTRSLVTWGSSRTAVVAWSGSRSRRRPRSARRTSAVCGTSPTGSAMTSSRVLSSTPGLRPFPSVSDSARSRSAPSGRSGASVGAILRR